MTAERDFSSMDEGYSVEWTSGHDTPQEYSVYGWVKASAVSSQHMIYRFTTVHPEALGDAENLGDRALFAAASPDGVSGHTYNYD
jgi:hypothetical protein